MDNSSIIAVLADLNIGLGKIASRVGRLCREATLTDEEIEAYRMTHEVTEYLELITDEAIATQTVVTREIAEMKAATIAAIRALRESDRGAE